MQRNRRSLYWVCIPSTVECVKYSCRSRKLPKPIINIEQKKNKKIIISENNTSLVRRRANKPHIPLITVLFSTCSVSKWTENEAPQNYYTHSCSQKRRRHNESTKRRRGGGYNSNNNLFVNSIKSKFRNRFTTQRTTIYAKKISLLVLSNFNLSVRIADMYNLYVYRLGKCTYRTCTIVFWVLKGRFRSSHIIRSETISKISAIIVGNSLQIPSSSKFEITSRR